MLDIAEAVQQGIFGMDVQVDEGHGPVGSLLRGDQMGRCGVRLDDRAIFVLRAIIARESELKTTRILKN
jgi:hypothetical protein